MRLALPAVVLATALLASCGGSQSRIVAADEVQEAFEEEGFSLVDSDLFESEDGLAIDALYSAVDPSVAAGEPILFVAVFEDDQSARDYATTDASPLGRASDAIRMGNVVLYLKQELSDRTTDAARRALEGAG